MHALLKMMKKHYIQPTLEILPYRTQIAICSGGSGSGETNETMNTSGNTGGNPWTGGMVPRRTPVF